MQRGKFLSFKISGRNDLISGIVLNYNEKWVLIRRCFDYRLDGFTIFAYDKDVKSFFGDHERMASSIMRKKKYNYKKEALIPIHSLEELLVYISRNFKLLQIDSKDGDSFDVLKYIKRVGPLFVFKELTTNAKWRYELRLQKEELTCISFNSEYLNSLKLLI